MKVTLRMRLYALIHKKEFLIHSKKLLVYYYLKYHGDQDKIREALHNHEDFDNEEKRESALKGIDINNYSFYKEKDFLRWTIMENDLVVYKDIDYSIPENAFKKMDELMDNDNKENK